MLVAKRNGKPDAMAALLEEYEERTAALRTSFAPGEAVVGTVVSVGGSTVALDLPSKMPGVIDRAQFEAADMPVPAPGDEITAYFIGTEDGAARLSLVPGAAAVQEAAEGEIGAAYAAKIPLEGKFEKEVNGGYEVRVAGQRAFCPFSQVALHRSREGAPSPVGTVSTFLVTEFNPAERTLVVSHRAIEERERDARRDTLRTSLFEGDMRHGVVTKVMPFGAFVDIGGVEGLVPASEISWDRSVKPGDILHEGDGVQVKVRRIDWENERFSFSLKDLAQDPWKEWCEDFGPGSYVTGRVVKLMPFGAFVQLVPGVDGLVPISSLGRGRRIVRPEEAVSVGEELDLKVESVDETARKISLSLVDKRVQALAPGEIAVGATLKGIVESVRDFGVFVRLSEEKTGLLHVSETGLPRGASAAQMEAKFPPGADVEVVVKGLDGDRISLMLPSTVAAAAAAEKEENDVRDLLRGNAAAAKATDFGSLGSLLDAALAAN